MDFLSFRFKRLFAGRPRSNIGIPAAVFEYDVAGPFISESTAGLLRFTRPLPTHTGPSCRLMGQSLDKPIKGRGRKAFTSEELQFLQQTYNEVALRYGTCDLSYCDPRVYRPRFTSLAPCLFPVRSVEALGRASTKSCFCVCLS